MDGDASRDADAGPDAGGDGDGDRSLGRRLVRGWRRARGHLFGATVACTLAFLYLPVVVIAYLSLSPASTPDVPITGVSFRWYAVALSDDRFVRGFVSSAGIGVVTALLGTALGAMAAHVVVRSRLPRGVRAAVGLLVALPLFVPTIVLALGIGVFSARVGLGFGLVPTLAGHLFFVLPFSTFLLTARYAELDGRLTEAARVLGASDATAFRTITLPLLAPALVASVLFCFALSFNEFLITFFLAGSGVTTLPIEIFSNLRTARISLLNAVSTLVLLASAVVAVAASRLRSPVSG